MKNLLLIFCFVVLTSFTLKGSDEIGNSGALCSNVAIELSEFCSVSEFTEFYYVSELTTTYCVMKDGNVYCCEGENYTEARDCARLLAYLEEAPR